jgi:hypothetical protein
VPRVSSTRSGVQVMARANRVLKPPVLGAVTWSAA